MNRITMGFTPDPDDAFAVYALVSGKVKTPGMRLNFHARPIEVLNRMVTTRVLEVAAISSVLYPSIQGQYAILRPGASVGRGYGPVVAARQPMSLDDLKGKIVALPGLTTTGTTLFRLFQPGAYTRSFPFEAIREAIRKGDVDAGVLIHEELLNYPDSGLHQVSSLGEEWLKQTGLPLPVGLNVIRRDLGDEVCRRFSSYLQESISYALANAEEAFQWAQKFARGVSVAISRKFVNMFANEDTLRFGNDCEQGLRRLFSLLHERQGAPRVGEIKFIEPSDGTSWRRSQRTVPEFAS